MFLFHLIVLSMLMLSVSAFSSSSIYSRSERKSHGSRRPQEHIGYALGRPFTNGARRHALPSPEESAEALRDYMAKSHEEKIKALAAVEAKYQGRIQELEEKVKQLEGRSPVQTSTNSYEFPATNKSLTNKVEEYRNLLSTYLVNAQKEKVTAVATAEAKLKDYYETIIEELKSEGERPVPEPSVGVTKEAEPAELRGKGGFQ